MMSDLRLTAEQHVEFNIIYERIAGDDIALQDFIIAAIYFRAELERRLAEANKLVTHYEVRLTCVCGSWVDQHGIENGHTSVSMYDYALDNLREQLQAAESALSAKRDEVIEVCAKILDAYAIRLDDEMFDVAARDIRALKNKR
jgi:hypothetical protein